MPNPITKAELDALTLKVKKSHLEAEKLWIKIENLDAAIKSAVDKVSEIKPKKPN